MFKWLTIEISFKHLSISILQHEYICRVVELKYFSSFFNLTPFSHLNTSVLHHLCVFVRLWFFDRENYCRTWIAEKRSSCPPRYFHSRLQRYLFVFLKIFIFSSLLQNYTITVCVAKKNSTNFYLWKFLRNKLSWVSQWLHEKSIVLFISTEVISTSPKTLKI